MNSGHFLQASQSPPAESFTQAKQTARQGIKKMSSTLNPETVVRNGVNVTGLMESIEAIKGEPTIAEFTFRNHNAWIDGALNRSNLQ